MAFAGLKSEEDRQAVIAYMEANGGSMYAAFANRGRSRRYTRGRWP